jgi:hemoglobin
VVGRQGRTAFERIGGHATVHAVVERLYERVLADPQLAPYFRRTSIPVQRDKLAGMVTEALGGPRSPWMTGLVEAHQGRGISHDDFERMSSHLLGALRDLEVPRREERVVARWLASTRWSVVDDS